MPLDSQGSDVLDLWQRGVYQDWPVQPTSQPLQHQPHDSQIEQERLRFSTQTSAASQSSVATVQPSIGDGNCFFRFCSFSPKFLEAKFYSSLVIALFGSENEYAQIKLREEVIDRLEQLWKTGARRIRDFITCIGNIIHLMRRSLNISYNYFFFFSSFYFYFIARNKTNCARALRRTSLRSFAAGTHCG